MRNDVVQRERVSETTIIEARCEEIATVMPSRLIL